MQKRTSLSVLLFVMCLSSIVLAQVPASTDQPSHDEMKDLLSIRPADRITAPIFNEQRVALPGQRHPMARAEFSIGGIAPDLYMGRMVLLLKPDAAQDAALDELLRAQQDSASRYYHRWLTPEQLESALAFRKTIWHRLRTGCDLSEWKSKRFLHRTAR
jgi:hypothetical protein